MASQELAGSAADDGLAADAPPSGRIDPAARILVVAEDAAFGSWLKYRFETTLPEPRVTICDFDELRRRRASLTRRDCELFVLVAKFDADADPDDLATGPEGLAWLRKLREQPGFPAILAIAEEGDELTAIRALRLGAADYLPRRLVTPKRLVDAAAPAIAAARAATAQAASSREAARDARVAPPAPAAATPPRVDNTPLPRRLIPRYTLLQKLGESERSVVYLARSESLGRNVALKVTRRSGEESSDFAREYAAISALSHPGVVEIHDYGVHEGREFIAMEYFPCGDLKARLQNPISEAQSLDYLRRMAQPLAVVHAAGIVHRDLKPPNVMLRENGQVVLIDFGIARLIGGTRTTAAGMLRGSPYYMSPEQAQGQALDTRSDLYSLGVILYEMLVGMRPFVGASAMDVLQQHVMMPPPTLPAAIAHHQGLIDRLLAKLPEDRFANAEELLQVLDAT